MTATRSRCRPPITVVPNYIAPTASTSPAPQFSPRSSSQRSIPLRLMHPPRRSPNPHVATKGSLALWREDDLRAPQPLTPPTAATSPASLTALSAANSENSSSPNRAIRRHGSLRREPDTTPSDPTRATSPAHRAPASNDVLGSRAASNSVISVGRSI